MKRFLIILLSLILITSVAVIIMWNQRASIAAGFIHRHLGVPVTIESLELTNQNATITELTIGNPSRFQSPSAFKAGSIEIVSTFDQIRANPLVIDEIVMNDLYIYVDNLKNGSTNWDQILAHHDERPSDRHYIIKTLILRNLNVTVIQPDGQTKQYPALARMEFHNISDKTGFPVDEIEKAIFNEMMKNLFQQFNIQKIIQPLIPGGQLIPNLFGLMGN